MNAHPPTYELTLDELRQRVHEAEKLLRVARQLAADELRDPEQSTRAKDRIASLCKEVNALFPPPPASPEIVGEDEDDEPGEEEGDDDWEVDYGKLRAAIDDGALMDRIPEAERATFRQLAEQLLEAHARQELYARVTAGFEELERTTRRGADEVGRQLAMSLTFEELGKKYKD
jgi:hypothetical protein